MKGRNGDGSVLRKKRENRKESQIKGDREKDRKRRLEKYECKIAREHEIIKSKE